MSVCPSCQQEAVHEDFCPGCFVSIRQRHSSSILRDQLVVAPTEESPQRPGLNLQEIVYRPSSWTVRVFLPNLKRMAWPALLVGLVGGGLLIMDAQQRAAADREALAHLAKMPPHQQRKNWRGARLEGEAALVQATLAQNPPLLCKTHLALADLASAHGDWAGAVRWYQEAVKWKPDKGLEYKLQRATLQAQAAACKRAQGLLRQAQGLLAEFRYLEASEYGGQACQLLAANKGSSRELCRAHTVTGQAFKGLRQMDECRRHLRLAQEADPSNSFVHSLLAGVTAPPPAPPTIAPKRRSAYTAPSYMPPPPPVYRQPLQGYPTYPDPRLDPRFSPNYARPTAPYQVPVPGYPVVPVFPSAYHPPSMPGRYPR